MNEPIQASWAQGGRHVGLSLILFWLGGACVAVSLIIGLQAVAVSSLGDDFGREFLAIPGWGVVAVILALTLRRNPESKVALGLGGLWLVIGLSAAFWFSQAHD